MGPRCHLESRRRSFPQSPLPPASFPISATHERRRPPLLRHHLVLRAGSLDGLLADGTSCGGGRRAGDHRCRPQINFSARHLFDEMDKKATCTREDPFRVLPDDVLDHILSFLLGDDAMQTCVLNTQWRDLWRRKTSLRFILDEWSSYSTQRFNQLVKLIIHLRGDSPLTDCQINPCGDVGHCDFSQTKLLIEYVLKCRVEDLLVCAGEYVHDPLLLEARLISLHLRTIEFGNVDLVDSSLDFSGCPVLQELRFLTRFLGLPSITGANNRKLLRWHKEDMF
ncbi:hypothetical protein VPH35_119005 [Triticum aestivum]